MTLEDIEVPGVTVRVGIKEEGEPFVVLLTENSGPNEAVIHVSVSGMNEEQLCALLRVVTRTIEGRSKGEK